MSNRNVLVEVCCDHLESALIASKNKAHRLEICSALALGGLTPSVDTVKEIQDQVETPLMILIRPRAGNFCYSNQEKRLILKEINTFLLLSIQGIVFGALNEEDEIDIAFLESVLKECRDVDFTFHRAIDFVTNWQQSLENLIEKGCPRILSSGQKNTAEEGLNVLQEMTLFCGDEMIIMPGSGIHKGNILMIQQQLQAKEMHLSAKKTMKQTKHNDPFNIDYYRTDEYALKDIFNSIDTGE